MARKQVGPVVDTGLTGRGSDSPAICPDTPGLFPDTPGLVGPDTPGICPDTPDLWSQV